MTDRGMTQKPELHPDQECCKGIIEPSPKSLTEKLREIHARPVLILRLRERWKRNG